MTILWCKDCNRYLQPPKHWVRAELESKELLTFCLKRIKGLQKVKLVDAGFIWTEPHSKRLKVKAVIQAEVRRGWGERRRGREREKERGKQGWLDAGCWGGEGRGVRFLLLMLGGGAAFAAVC